MRLKNAEARGVASTGESEVSKLTRNQQRKRRKHNANTRALAECCGRQVPAAFRVLPSLPSHLAP
eukprot:9766256-Lingulodinium_polyedra.AAC.1